MLTDADIGSGSVRFAKDYIGVDYHNDGHSHIDALCHVAYDGALYDGHPDDVGDRAGRRGRRDRGRSRTVWSAAGCCSTCPALRGVPWLEPGEHVFREDLEAAEREQGVRVGAGRHPAGAHRPRAPPGRARAVGHDAARRRACTRRRRASSPSAASPRSARTATATPRRAPPRGSRSRSTSWRSTRWASTCSTTCSSRTSPRAARTRAALGVPVRRRAAADPRRDGIAAQPDRDLLTQRPAGASGGARGRGDRGPDFGASAFLVPDESHGASSGVASPGRAG